MSQLARTTTPQITILNGNLNTTSLAVADYFGRQHRNVMQTIEGLDCSVNFRSANFSALVKNVDMPQGRGTKEIKFYDITRDGFTMLAMGFTGKKAMAFKEGYIMAFNKMETELLKKYQQPAIESTTLTPSSQRTVQEAVSTLAHDNKAYAKYYGALKTHFRVGTYKDIPNDQLEEALQVLQGVVIEPKAIEQASTETEEDLLMCMNAAAALKGKIIIDRESFFKMAATAKNAFVIFEMMEKMKDKYMQSLGDIEESIKMDVTEYKFN